MTKVFILEECASELNRKLPIAQGVAGLKGLLRAAKLEWETDWLFAHSATLFLSRRPRRRVDVGIRLRSPLVTVITSDADRTTTPPM
jgi:hypothetical protein